MRSTPQTDLPLIEQFLDSLRSLPGVQATVDTGISASRPTSRIDAKIDLEVAGKSMVLLAQAKTAVYPRDVEQALGHWRMLADGRDDGAQHLLLAESFSPGAKEMLRAAHVSYFERSGSMFLPVSGAYIFIDRPSSKSMERSVKSLFTGRSAQVIHALLIGERSWFGVSDIAQKAQVAPSTASQVLSELARFNWLESRGGGPNKERQIRDPGALLDAWAKQRPSSRAQVGRRFYVPNLNSQPLMERLGRVFSTHGVDYAVTSESAGQCYAPYLTHVSQVRTRVLPSKGAILALAELDARSVDEGVNLVVLDCKSMGELQFRQNVDGVWLASPVQVYLDLLQGAGRSKELAEHLRRERIGF